MRLMPIVCTSVTNHPELVDLTTHCPFCHKANPVIHTTWKAYLEWHEGALIQRAMPTLTPSEREYLITGICDACFPTDSREDD